MITRVHVRTQIQHEDVRHARIRIQDHVDRQFSRLARNLTGHHNIAGIQIRRRVSRLRNDLRVRKVAVVQELRIEAFHKVIEIDVRELRNRERLLGVNHHHVLSTVFVRIEILVTRHLHVLPVRAHTVSDIVKTELLDRRRVVGWICAHIRQRIGRISTLIRRIRLLRSLLRRLRDRLFRLL